MAGEPIKSLIDSGERTIEDVEKDAKTRLSFGRGSWFNSIVPFDNADQVASGGLQANQQGF